MSTPKHTLYRDRDIDSDDIIRVTATADVKATGAAISNALYENDTVTVRALGAAAVNQAVKAIVIARTYVAVRGVDLVVRPGFLDIVGKDGTKLSVVVLRIHVE